MQQDSFLPMKCSIDLKTTQADICPVIVIFAPTACGKTALAVDLFGKSSLSQFKGRGEVVCADSQTVYTGLDIGTAKPSDQELALLPHRGINLFPPSKQFGVGDFVDMADRECKAIYSLGKFPLLVGGCGFYIRNFLVGLPPTPISDPSVREEIKAQLNTRGNKDLYAELKKIDPLYAKKININDSYRICRALEVYRISGRPLSSCVLPNKLRTSYNFCIIVLSRKREDLYNRIDKRVDEMFSLGLAEEVSRLKKQGFTKNSPGMKAIGYSEFFEENLSLQEIKEKIKIDSHHYAKKQYTFMKGIPGARLFDAGDSDSIKKAIGDFCLAQGEFL